MTDHEFALAVTSIEAATATINVLTLRSPSGDSLPDWTPGAHIDLVLPNGLVRQYSLCGPSADRRSWRIGVLRDVASRGGSEFVHSSLTEGDIVTVRGPRNTFELAPAENYLFIAGGIGVTPLIEMAREAERRGAEWSFLYCGRNAESMALLDELQSDFGDRLRVHTDAESGFFDFAGEFAQQRPSTTIYACGPGPFLDVITAATSHWPSGSVRFERFAPITIDGAINTEIDIELARKGRTLTVPADQSILQVLREAGVPILSSCGEGTCGACEVAVLEGKVDHRDSVLSEEEQQSNEMMMVCVSRCRGRRLVLDL